MGAYGPSSRLNKIWAELPSSLSRREREGDFLCLYLPCAHSIPSGEAIPVLGQGTWHLAEGLHPREVEIAALRLGIALGMTLIDTAEMYADGAADELVGEALAGRRDEVRYLSDNEMIGVRHEVA